MVRTIGILKNEPELDETTNIFHTDFVKDLLKRYWYT